MNKKYHNDIFQISLKIKDSNLLSLGSIIDLESQITELVTALIDYSDEIVTAKKEGDVTDGKA